MKRKKNSIDDVKVLNSRVYLRADSGLVEKYTELAESMGYELFSIRKFKKFNKEKNFIEDCTFAEFVSFSGEIQDSVIDQTLEKIFS